MDFPSGRRDYRRLCNCGTPIVGGTFCDTCYENQTLRERVRKSHKDWRASRTWNGDDD